MVGAMANARSSPWGLGETICVNQFVVCSSNHIPGVNTQRVSRAQRIKRQDLSSHLSYKVCRRYGARFGVNSTSCFANKRELGLHDRSFWGRGTKEITHVVASNPPLADSYVAVRNEPLSKDDLVSYLASGCKPKEKWRIGAEYEKFGFELGTLKPMDYSHTARLMEEMARRFGWQRVFEDGRIIGLKMDDGSGQTISLEAGGQFELSGAPMENLHQSRAELNSYLSQIKDIGEELGLGFLGLGYQPKWRASDIPLSPKARYEIIRKCVLQEDARNNLEVMRGACAVQVNLDFSSEEDMVRKFQVGLALQPVATTLFANSPLVEGKPSGYASYRSYTWTQFLKKRVGNLPVVFSENFGFQDYVEYALEIPMLFLYREQAYIDCSGLSFKDFLAGRLPVLPGEFPTLKDWDLHLATVYTDVRLKKVLEMRGADAGPRSSLLGLPAFWVGLLYDEESLEAARDVIRNWTECERAMLFNQAPRLGLRTPFRGGLLKDVAEVVLKLAKEGLRRRGFGEEKFLIEIEENLASDETMADRIIRLYDGEWKRSCDPIFEMMRY